MVSDAIVIYCLRRYFIEVPGERADSSIGRSSRSGRTDFDDSKAALKLEVADSSERSATRSPSERSAPE